MYLSPIIDCFGGMVVSWTIDTSPDAELVNTMLDEAIRHLSGDEHPILHSDRDAIIAGRAGSLEWIVQA